MSMGILIEYLSWHFLKVPMAILSAWRNILIFNLSYFSVPLLLKTLFVPWRRTAWSYGKGFNARRFLEVFASNLISRILGAIVRSFVIFAGLITELALIALGPLVLLFWFVLPILIVFSFFYGIELLI